MSMNDLIIYTTEDGVTRVEVQQAEIRICLRQLSEGGFDKEQKYDRVGLGARCLAAQAKIARREI